jgi:hypothetical protein
MTSERRQAGVEEAHHPVTFGRVLDRGEFGDPGPSTVDELLDDVGFL